MKKGAGLLSIFPLVLIDQCTKAVARSALANGDISLIPGVLELHYLENDGMAFSLFSGKIWLFNIMTPILCAVILFCYLRLPSGKRYMPLHLSFVLLLSGALGNYIDRLLRRSVTDFIYVSLIDFPVFNVADIYVTMAMFALVLLILFYYKDEEVLG